MSRPGERAWEQGSSPGIWRQRFVVEGPIQEAGCISELVRYEPRARSLLYEHTGQEILVLDGMLSDESGNFATGSHLLIPEGQRSPAFTDAGCLLFVRSRALPDSARTCRDTLHGDWSSRGFPGAHRQWLYDRDELPERAWLTRLDAETRAPTVPMPHGEEIFVVEGQFEDEFGSYPKHTWLRFAAGTSHTPRTTTGCLLYVAVPPND